MTRFLNPVYCSLIAVPVLVIGMVLVLFTMRNMPALWQYGTIIPMAYLLGSIPWGYVILQWRHGVDIRQYGSGRTGMSNVLRTAGKNVAAAVLALDVLKGVLAVLLAREVIGTTTAEVTTGLLVLIGHNWPVFLGFRGGRGIATGLGGLAIMAPIPAAVAAVAFLPIILLSRYLSLGSIIGVIIAFFTVLGMAMAGMYATAYTLYAFIGGAIIIWQHRDNIQGIIKGTERRLGAPAVKIQ